MIHAHRILRKAATLGVLTAMVSTGVATATMTSAFAANGSVSGSVSAANRPATPGYVVAYQWNGVDWDYIDDARISRTTKTYSLSLPPGDNYLMCVTAADSPLFCADGDWGYPVRAPGAGVVSVPDGGSASVNLAIPELGGMTGSVTGAAGAEADSEVGLLRWNGTAFEFIDFDYTNGKGQYDLGSVPAGTYTMSFERQVDGVPGFEQKWLGGNAVKPTTASGPGVFTIAVRETVKSFNFDGLSPAPTATTAPSLPTTSTVGQTLTVNPGVWTETPDFSFQWLRDGAPIAGAVATTYKVTPADAGSDLTVRMGATQAGNAPGTAVTAASTVQQLKSKVVVKAKPDSGSKTDKVKLKVKVLVTGLTATGKVKVSLGSKTVAKGAVKNGRATVTLKLSKLEAGKNKLTVDYLGSKAVAASKGKVKVMVTS